MERILRENELVEMVGLSRVTLYRMEGLGLFTARIQLGYGRAVGWRLAEVIRWIDSRPVGIKKVTV